MSATIDAVVRERLGSRHSKKLRLAGRVPACIQGEGKEHANVALDEVQFLTARRHHEHLFDIEIDGHGTETAIVNELQYDSLGDAILHVEFRRVVRGKPIEAEVELKFRGQPKGGILNHLITHVMISALPSELPDGIEVKVEAMEEDAQLHGYDLVMPEGVTLVTDPETIVATVTIARGIEETPSEDDELEGLEGEAAPEADAEAGDSAAGSEDGSEG